MTEDRLEHALGGGIGLSNVNERLRTIYGAQLPPQADRACRGRARARGVEIPELAVPERVTALSHGPCARWLVDDEQLARDELGYLLGPARRRRGHRPGRQRRRSADARIERLQPDVVFLDVQMPGLTGFEVARRMLDTRGSSHIIFVTAYDQHAIEAFEVNAVDYLLKPVDQARLESRASTARGGGSQSSVAERRATAVGGRRATRDSSRRSSSWSAERQNRRERLAIKVGERFMLVQAEEIIYASLRRRRDHRGHEPARRDVELPDARRAAGPARRQRLLARASVASREHQQDQGDRPLVQPELHPEDEGREVDGNPREPHADAAAAGVPEAVEPPSGRRRRVQPEPSATPRLAERRRCRRTSSAVDRPICA